MRLAISVTSLLFLFACGGDDDAALVIRGSSEAPPAQSLVSALRFQAISATKLLSDGTPVGAPAQLNFGIYKLLLSENADCSDPITAVDHGADDVVTDLATNPTLFSASPPNGTYKCIIIRHNDVISYKSAVAQGSCNTTTTYSFDSLRADSETTPQKDPDGNEYEARGTSTSFVEDKPYIYITSAAGRSAMEADGFDNENQFVTLESNLVVPGSATLYWDLSEAIRDDGTNCNLAPETGFEFR